MLFQTPYSSSRFSFELYKPPKTAAALQVLASCECLTSTTHETVPNLVGLNSIGSFSGDDTIHKLRLLVDLFLTATTLLTEQGSFP